MYLFSHGFCSGCHVHLPLRIRNELLNYGLPALSVIDTDQDGTEASSINTETNNIIKTVRNNNITAILRSNIYNMYDDYIFTTFSAITAGPYTVTDRSNPR